MKIIYVYESFSSEDSILMGILYVDNVRGNENFSFEYDNNWLKNNNISIDPDMNLYAGRQFPINKEIFGVLSDSEPDRWGRMLLKRREAYIAKKEGRAPNKLYESDFLLGVYDETRTGALRFKLDKDKDFLSNDKNFSTPPWVSLRKLENIAIEIEDGNEEYDKWIDQLVNPGSSLGGARPKANVIDTDGNLWIAKFPSKNDENDVGAWEKVASDLAKLCGLNVPESKIEKFSKYGNTFLVKRFDRERNKRIHFASCMTLLSKQDGIYKDEGTSYLDIASFIKQNGANPNNDLLELWKRIAFNMLIKNTDDHLRNHGFILAKKGWVLSPLFDVNPSPYGDYLSLLVNEYDSKISLNLLLSVSKYFKIEENAIEILSNMQKIIKDNWKDLALKYKIKNENIEKMKHAFDLCYENV